MGFMNAMAAREEEKSEPRLLSGPREFPLHRHLRYVALVVFVLSLAVPSTAVADHPWSPPAWYNDVASGGQQTPNPPGTYDCVVRHTVERDDSGGLRNDYSQECSKTYPGGPAACEGKTLHYTNNPASAYSPPTHYTREFACRITPGRRPLLPAGEDQGGERIQPAAHAGHRVADR
jgi:hypothetical protein